MTLKNRSRINRNTKVLDRDDKYPFIRWRCKGRMRMLWLIIFRKLCNYVKASVNNPECFALKLSLLTAPPTDEVILWKSMPGVREAWLIKEDNSVSSFVLISLKNCPFNRFHLNSTCKNWQFRFRIAQSKLTRKLGNSTNFISDIICLCNNTTTSAKGAIGQMSM